MKPFALGKALLYAALLWVGGFFWGSIVYMTPALKSVPPIPFVSGNPVISFPILLLWLVFSWLLARNFLKSVERKADAGRKLGVVFALVNMLLDLVVLVLLLKAGFGFYASLAVWVAYAILFVVPWQLGRRQP